MEVVTRLRSLHAANPDAPISAESVIGAGGVQVGAGVVPLAPIGAGKPAAGAGAQLAVAPGTTPTRFCPACGSAVAGTDRFCRGCGAGLPGGGGGGSGGPGPYTGGGGPAPTAPPGSTRKGSLALPAAAQEPPVNNNGKGGQGYV